MKANSVCLLDDFYLQKVVELKINFTLQNIGQEHLSQLQRVIKNAQNLEALYYRFDFNDNIEEVLQVVCDSIFEHKNLNSLHLQLLKCQLNFSALQMMENKLSKIENLQSLTLNLRYNFSKQDGSLLLGKIIANCAQLQYLNLDLSFNKMEAEGFLSLTEGIKLSQNLKNLTLSLRENQIRSDTIYQCLANIGQCQKLQNLFIDFRENYLKDKGLVYLGQGMQHVSHIQELTLYVHKNAFGDQGLLELSQGISLLVNLRKIALDLSYNKIQNESTESILETIWNLQNLEVIIFDVSGNDINDSICFSDVPCDKQIENLKHLQLNFNFLRFQNWPALQLIQRVIKYKNLKFLSLEMCCDYITDETIIELSKSFKNLINLKTMILDFSGNSIRETGVASLQEIQYCSQITKLYLNLSGNTINSEGAISIGNTISKLLQVEELNISFYNCNFSENVFYEIMKQIYKCKSLKLFQVTVRQIQQKLHLQIRRFFMKLNKLVLMNFSFR
ncbi:kinase domain protein (macronuclear) [Tetrahymena thermophila SB210]|uniref:Kinase domain protein n=1 Tax=Tetrahymena thermophila (strain SB210) TaxID=312017 RepID=Q23W11_TETTS|nr:kinase domain protein [Tetrahymena thermophila SB210]EAS00694.2 kinase domain protein [Tetrahymena thermophila SB210]|eukprot:XP_001020939.2 kinase domain protein [Tetrahymena thermophila SB210]